MKIKNIGTRAICCDGRWIAAGEVALVGDNSDWQQFVNRGLAEAYQVPISEPGKYSREALESMKMADLRKIGTPMGVKDDDKKELIEEILNKQR